MYDSCRTHRNDGELDIATEAMYENSYPYVARE